MDGACRCFLTAITGHASRNDVCARMFTALRKWYDVILSKMPFTSSTAVGTSMFIKFLNQHPFDVRELAYSCASLKCSPSLDGSSTPGSRLLNMSQKPPLCFFPIDCSGMFRVFGMPRLNSSLTFVLIILSIGFCVLLSGLWMVLYPLSVNSVSYILCFLVVGCMEFSSTYFTFSAQPAFLCFAEKLSRSLEYLRTFSAFSFFHAVIFTTLATEGK